MAGIAAMVDELVKTYRPVPDAVVLFPSNKESVGPCPRCDGAVTESKKGFFCENRECRFVLWKDSKFFTAKKKTLAKAAAAALPTDRELYGEIMSARPVKCSRDLQGTGH